MCRADCASRRVTWKRRGRWPRRWWPSSPRGARAGGCSTGSGCRAYGPVERVAHRQVETAGLTGEPVMASRHQAAFCRCLGTERGEPHSRRPTRAVPSEIDDAVQSGREGGVRWIIANLPQGRQAADALADRFAAKVVVFGNFPDGQGAGLLRSARARQRNRAGERQPQP